MKPSRGNDFSIGRRPAIMLALLIALILGGNGLVILEFERARLQTDRLTGVSHELIAVLRLHESLLSFHQRLSELGQARDIRRLLTEAIPLRAALREQTRQTRNTLSHLPSGFRLDPAFLTALDAIETTLPTQLQDISGLAATGDWEAVRVRLENESKSMETATSAIVKTIDRDLDEELPRAVANMRDVQRRILFMVPMTALSTAFIAAIFGWAMARRILEMRVEERVNERTRIARELHDTLLQSFQGMLMKLSVVSYRIPDRPEVQQALETIVEQGRRAIQEGRDAVEGLRASTADSHDVAQAIRRFGEELISGAGDASVPEFEVHAAGTARDLPPGIWDEVNRIACEAVRNAFRHSQASRVQVEIQYGEHQFRLTVRDDGNGIDPKILEEGGRSGHHGLPGMRERARLAGGELTIQSKSGSGTEAEVTIPAAVAYRKPPLAGRSTTS